MRVSISIWFHNWSDERHDQAQEKQFLDGFRTDLASDIVNIKNSLNFYQNSFRGMQYFAALGAGGTLNNDSLKKYSNIFFSSTTLSAHISRYEALKSSGRLGIIEDQELLNNIIELNESTFAHIQFLNDDYLKFMGKAGDYIQQNAELDPPGRMTNAAKIFRTSQWRFLITFSQSSLLLNVIPANQDGLKKCDALLKEIDKQSK